jgi:hypothetical protein
MKRLPIPAALAALVVPVQASATIVINRGMYGVSLGATMKHVRQHLGTPTNVLHVGGRTWWVYFQLDATLAFRGKHRLLHSLFTQSTGERTARGAGVGSSEQDVTRLVRGVRCRTIVFWTRRTAE